MVRLKRIILEVGSKENCLTHVLIIALARLKIVLNYIAYRIGRHILPTVQQLLVTIGIDRKNGAKILDLTTFQEHFREYKIVVYVGLNCDSVMFQGSVEADKRNNLLFDGVTQHYHAIANLTVAMAKRYVCVACNIRLNMTWDTLGSRYVATVWPVPLCIRWDSNTLGSLQQTL